MKMKYDIDVVIPWVDSSDPNWIYDFNKYAPKDKQKVDLRKERYRDNGLLKYWFRGIEKFAPWVRTIHFVTCGQKPDWLNLNNPKLHWVKHSDYIPSEYLPVFNSHPIEIMMHRIPGLAERFIYFNDDMFLISPVTRDMFFADSLHVKDSAIQNVLSSSPIGNILLNDIQILNKNFIKRSVVRKNFFKFFNISYGKNIFRNLFLIPWPNFTGFLNHHVSQPFFRSIFEEVWQECPCILEETMRSKFRSISDVNQYLFRYWQLCKGFFVPINIDKGRKYFELTDNPTELCQAIERQSYRQIVINDANITNYEQSIEMIVASFNKILPEKSFFEI